MTVTYCELTVLLRVSACPFGLQAVKLQKRRAGRDVCVCCESVCVCIQEGFLCIAGVSVVLSAGSRPGGSVRAESHREQMVNGCVTRSIDFLTQTPGHAAVGTQLNVVVWQNVLISG